MTDAIAGSNRNRRAYAQLLRHFAAGLLTNDQFEDANVGRHDEAMIAIGKYAWHHYSDLYEHRLRGRHRLTPDQRRVFARCVLFLHTELPYEWSGHRWALPRRSGVMAWLATWLSGLEPSATPMPECDDATRLSLIDDRIWPFRRMSDYKRALARPRLLAGS